MGRAALVALALLAPSSAAAQALELDEVVAQIRAETRRLRPP